MRKPALVFRGLAALALLFSGSVMAAGAGVEMASAQVDLSDKGSLQRGAGLFMNYCSACHSLSLQRYSRMAEDIGLTEEQVVKHLMPGDAKFGETMTTGMDPKQATAWLGKAPPDLSLVARSKAAGADWTYNYLKSFYVDESRPMGWNNAVFPGASMPHVLWELQGSQHALTEPKPAGGHCPKGEAFGQCITGYSIPEHKKGSLTAEEYDQVARDLTTFLAYVGEPSAQKRQSIGVWAVLFLAFFTLLAYFLNKEYWRDIH